MTLRDLPISSREEVSKKETVKQSRHCEPKQHLPQKPFALFIKEMGYELPERHPMQVPFSSRFRDVVPLHPKKVDRKADKRNGRRCHASDQANAKQFLFEGHKRLSLPRWQKVHKCDAPIVASQSGLCQILTSGGLFVPDNDDVRQFRARIAADLKQYKRAIVGVRAEDARPAFCYTIGNWWRGLPELLVIGVINSSMLHFVSEMMIKREHAFADGELVDLGGQYPGKIIHADDPRAKRDFTVQAGQFLATEDYEVQQLLVPDRTGRFPDEPGCQPPYSTARILRRSL
jgi:hypothetical protein